MCGDGDGGLLRKRANAGMGGGPVFAASSSVSAASVASAFYDPLAVARGDMDGGKLEQGKRANTGTGEVGDLSKYFFNTTPLPPCQPPLSLRLPLHLLSWPLHEWTGTEGRLWRGEWANAGTGQAAGKVGVVGARISYFFNMFAAFVYASFLSTSVSVPTCDSQ